MLCLLGVVVSFYPDIQTVFQYRVHGSGGKIETKLYTHFGISAVIPAERIQEILDSAALVSERRERVKEEHIKTKPEAASLGKDFAP
jgi:hypothetical protein